MVDRADRIAMGLQAGVNAARFGWYLSLNRVVGWQSDRLGLKPRTPPARSGAQRPAPSERQILADLGDLLRRDAQAVRDGLYPPLTDGVSPLEHIGRARAMLADLPAALERRAREHAGSVQEVAGIAALPDYYTQDFHYQTGGYLSAESARLYDVQVETLFLGGAGPMRREALRPIGEHLAGRDQRKLALVDVGCGTGRFLRDVRLAWPALGLTGIDLSDSYLDETRRHMHGLRPATLLQGNGEAMPLADASQDVATTIFLFHELPPEARRTVAADMARVLKPGGLMVLIDSLQMGDRPGWDGLLEAFPVRFHEPFFESYAIDDLDGLLADEGLLPVANWTSFFAKVMVRRKAG